MKTLYLLRHAEAALALIDYDRPLTEKGLADAGRVRKFMQDNGFVPDLIVSSSARRTTQTTQAVLFGKHEGAVFTRDLYGASTAELLDTIHRSDPAKERLLLVAHNPGVAELAYALGQVTRYQPGTLSIFTATDWTRFAPGEATLLRVFAPD